MKIGAIKFDEDNVVVIKIENQEITLSIVNADGEEIEYTVTKKGDE